MGYMHGAGLEELLAGWEEWRCAAEGCSQERLRVARRSQGEDVWLLYERPGWVMVASIPVCPCCGTTLRRQS